MIEAVLSMVLVLAMFILVLVLAYYATKFVGKKYGARGQGSQMIRVLDRVAISQDKQLLIIRAAGKTMLIGTAPHAISKLCDIDETELPPEPDEEPGPAFSQVLSNLIRDGIPPRGKKKQGGDEETIHEEDRSRDDQ